MTHRLSPGDSAPDFTLTDARGEQVSLADLRGQRSVVYFYPKAFTPGCTTEACDFRDNETRFAERGYRILGISADSPETLQDFAREHDLAFPLLSDPGSRAAQAWGAWGERTINGETSVGPVRTTIILEDDGTVLSADYGVAVPDHVVNLIGALDS
ncbi:peroxiredoxin [Brachybacterium vulturis]|uniref:thioredoxin-dependent peroxiredoxin n=1 Tax=Brachybacterium vulturis TaxID=2017484 RepID=A0A291GQU9_9MICO|nr:peroxiredoxin [Brachybacterium vulturis]ATG52739.1 peroxiredoxin [Brachybacterium vulturis]